MYYLKRYFQFLPVLAFLFAAVLMPYLHMGGIVCSHSDHASASHLCCERELEAGASTYNSDGCGDDKECQICSFLENYSAVKGVLSICLFTQHADFAYESAPYEMNLPGKVYSSNPATAPPSLI